jgi:branched-chain amino acid transport system ATP-binding protein
MTEPLLEIDGITKRFGSFTAVDDISFSIDRDSDITALIGPNGAGKTTTYNVLTGKLRATEGSMRFLGEDITDASPAERTKRGMGRSFQITNIFEGLTVRQNLRIPIISASKAKRDFLGNVEKNTEVNERVDEVLELVGLEGIGDTQCDVLSYGDKRRVEIGITLATDPEFVLLDEPTAGMNPRETSKMVSLIERLDEETDTAFFLTEHDMSVVFSIASRILVLHQGRIIADGSPTEIRENEQVQTAYLGGEEGSLMQRREDRDRGHEGTGETLLEVDGIDTYYGQSHVLDDVSLDVEEGEIVGILGRNGAGKTTTLRSIVGLTPPRSGEIRFRGQRIDDRRPFEIARAGIGFVPEERDVFGDLTVEDNLKVIAEKDSEWTIDRVYETFPRLEERAKQKSHQLSGGEQQMLTVARALVSGPDLLVLDEPSEGLAPVIVEDLGDVLEEVIETGMTVLMTEQNVEFGLSLSERNYILNSGRIEWEGTTDELLDNREVIETYISLSGVEEGNTPEAE